MQLQFNMNEKKNKTPKMLAQKNEPTTFTNDERLIGNRLDADFSAQSPEA